MKRHLLQTIFSTFAICLATYSFAQTQIENEIRAMDDRERQATLTKDTNALKTIWSRELIVNAPINAVVRSTGNIADRPVIARNKYSSFTRQTEAIQVIGAIVVSMGSETIVPTHDTPKKGQLVKRRYTHVWIKEDGSWKLAARHANDICN
jgi:ketosteroid isomerase-like protein